MTIENYKNHVVNTMFITYEALYKKLMMIPQMRYNNNLPQWKKETIILREKETYTAICQASTWASEVYRSRYDPLNKLGLQGWSIKSIIFNGQVHPSLVNEAIPVDCVTSIENWAFRCILNDRLADIKFAIIGYVEPEQGNPLESFESYIIWTAEADRLHRRNIVRAMLAQFKLFLNDQIRASSEAEMIRKKMDPDNDYGLSGFTIISVSNCVTYKFETYTINS